MDPFYKSSRCLRCGSHFHDTHNCDDLITSFGVIVLCQGKNLATHPGLLYEQKMFNCELHTPEKAQREREKNNEEQMVVEAESWYVLLVERKESIAYISLIQGTYPDDEPLRSVKLTQLLSEITCKERWQLTTLPFADQWELAGSPRRNEKKCARKFAALNISEHLEVKPLHHLTADFWIPKGRIILGESPLECAKREFQEESGYDGSSLVYSSIEPLQETFRGSDNRLYRNIAFICTMQPNTILPLKLYETPSQYKEVNNLGWFTLGQAIQRFRPCHYTRRVILRRAIQLLTNQIKDHCDAR